MPQPRQSNWASMLSMLSMWFTERSDSHLGMANVCCWIPHSCRQKKQVLLVTTCFSARISQNQLEWLIYPSAHVCCWFIHMCCSTSLSIIYQFYSHLRWVHTPNSFDLFWCISISQNSEVSPRNTPRGFALRQQSEDNLTISAVSTCHATVH